MTDDSKKRLYLKMPENLKDASDEELEALASQIYERVVGREKRP